MSSGGSTACMTATGGRRMIADNEQAQLRILQEQAQFNPGQGDIGQGIADSRAMPEPKDGFLREAVAHWNKRRKR